MWDNFRFNFQASQAFGKSALESGLGNTLPAPLSTAMPTGLASADTAWQEACEVYLRVLTQHTLSKPAADASEWTDLHLVVAELIWDQRSQLQPDEAHRLMHISHPSVGLLAVYSPEQRLVQVRRGAPAAQLRGDDVDMNVRLMPASAKLLEGKAAYDFQTLSVTLLMWHYGQSSALALSHMPSLANKWMFLRRFPALSPRRIDMRHLRLMHALSRAPVQFEGLLSTLVAEDRVFVCPDLTSLYFSGALQLKRSQPA
jgi:hypothetical protein